MDTSENFNYAWTKMEQIIRSWGWTQEEYRYKLAYLMPLFLLSLLNGIDKHIEEMGRELYYAETRKQKRHLRNWIKVCRQVQKTLASLQSEGTLCEKTFQFRNFDCAVFDHHPSFEMGDLRILLLYPESLLLIPSRIAFEVKRDSFSDEQWDVLKLAIHKSEVARHEKANPRTYWPALESRRRD